MAGRLLEVKAELHIDHQELVGEIAERVVEALKPMLSSKEGEDRLMSAEDLCKYLQVENNWIYQQVHSKSIPFLKAGNKLRFRKSEIDEYLRKRK